MKCSCGYELKKETRELGRWVEHKPTIEILHCDWCGQDYCPIHNRLMRRDGQYWIYCLDCDPQIKTREDIYNKYKIGGKDDRRTETNTERIESTKKSV